MGNVCSISISADDAFSRCWDCMARGGKYVCELGENNNALRIEWEELKRIRNDVKRRVDIAEEQQMKRLDQVEGWLVNVEGMNDEVDKLIADCSQEIDHKCFGGCCPKHCKTSYKLGKQVTKKLHEVTALKNKGIFDAVAEKLPLVSVDERPSEPTVGLERMFDKVWSYIGDENLGIIGLYGMGGVGKTTLLTQINNKLCNTTCFDVVIWVVVSKNPDPIKVQEDIGKRIGFRDETWKRKSQDEKANDIFGVLKNKKFMLFLDDIWERLELKEVGVPLPDKVNKSKVVFTTRFKNVCGLMEAHKTTKMECLVWKEAWDLFQRKVGREILNFPQEITKLAKVVAKECDGLPLALITIGRAMACKRTLEEWNHALLVLQKSAAQFSGMEEKVFHRLKFSYDNLRNDTDRSCFLYCSLFPEDYVISKERLISYWICEGFLDGFGVLNGDRNQGHDIIGILIHACLLEEDLKYNVKMHDMVRDMALWVSCNYGMVKDKVLVQAGSHLEKAPEAEKWKGVERISLMNNHIEELTETPLNSNLLTLFLSFNNLKTITPGFFQYNYHLDELPVEISELVSLQFLNVAYTNIKELPIEFKKLVGLKFLNLAFTTRLAILQRGVLSSFKKLRVLDMFGCGSSEYLSLEDSVLSDQDESLVEEIDCLNDLNHLGITIKNASSLQRFLSSPKFLRNFNELSLSLRLLRGSKYLDMSFLESTKCLIMFGIKDCMDLEDLRVERAGQGVTNLEIRSHICFQSLGSVQIEKCPMLKELTWLVFAPNVSQLWIINCHNMEEIICSDRRGEATEEGIYPNLFAKLEDVRLINLPQLKGIYPNALPFPRLVSLRVDNCPNLKKLPLNSDSAKGRRALILGQKKWWNDLEWEDEAARNAFLPSFESLNY